MRIGNHKLKSRYDIFLIIIIIILNAYLVDSICGDDLCESGYDVAEILINDTGIVVYHNLTMQQTLEYNGVTGAGFYLKLLSLDEITKIAIFDYEDTNLTLIKGVVVNLTEDITILLKDMLFGLGDEEKLCPADCNKCNTSKDCSDSNLCTTDLCTGTPRICININLTGCKEEFFKKIEEKFFLGNGPCRKEYSIYSVNTSKKEILIKRTSPEQIVTILYTNQPQNELGYLVPFRDNILGQNITYNLRYDENTSFLYIGEANNICPLVDACLSNKDCDDNDNCTFDKCDGEPLSCINKRISYCKFDDGCCPSRCSYLDDNDCINPNKCQNDLECSDNDTCTLDLCVGEPRLCENTKIEECITSDNCCPTGCDYQQDNDCIRTIKCGDGICEGNESIICCSDCGCDAGKECVNNICVKPLIEQASELLNTNPEIYKIKKELFDKKFVLNDTILVKNQKGGFDFAYIFKKNEIFAFINGTIYGNNVFISNFLSPPRYSINYLYLLGIGSVVIILGGITGLKIHKKRKEKRHEEYYMKLLHQRYVMGRQGYTQHYRQPYMHQRQQYHQTMYPNRQQQYPPQQRYIPQRQYPPQYQRQWGRR